MLDKKFGLTVAGSKYEEAALMGAYFALTGVNLGLDLGGRGITVLVTTSTNRHTIAGNNSISTYVGSWIRVFDDDGSLVMEGAARNQGELTNLLRGRKMHKNWNVENGNTPNGIYEITAVISRANIRGNEVDSYGPYQFLLEGIYGDIMDTSPFRGRNGNLLIHTGRSNYMSYRTNDIPYYLYHTFGCTRVENQFAVDFYNWLIRNDKLRDNHPDYFIIFDGDSYESLIRISRGLETDLNLRSLGSNISYFEYARNNSINNPINVFTNENNFYYHFFNYTNRFEALRYYFDYDLSNVGGFLRWR
ncbi:MAG: hypothetical protein ACP5Q5_00025 [Brevinematia bacterium]